MKTAFDSCPAATIRATLARFGRPVVATVDGKRLYVSPYEMPGEVEWRVDLMHWHSHRIAFELLLLPSDAAAACLERMSSELVLESHLHHLEAGCVLDAARVLLSRLKPRVTSISMQVVSRLERRIEARWEKLTERYVAIVLASARKMHDLV